MTSLDHIFTRRGDGTTTGGGGDTLGTSGTSATSGTRSGSGGMTGALGGATSGTTGMTGGTTSAGLTGGARAETAGAPTGSGRAARRTYSTSEDEETFGQNIGRMGRGTGGGGVTSGASKGCMQAMQEEFTPKQEATGSTGSRLRPFRSSRSQQKQQQPAMQQQQQQRTCQLDESVKQAILTDLECDRHRDACHGKLIKKLLIDRRENRHSRNIIHDLLTGQLDFTSKPKLPHKVACLLMQDCAADWAADAVIHKLLVDCKYNRKVDAIIGQLENTGTYVCQRNEGCETESKRMSQKFGEVVDRIASEDFGRSIVKACCTKERLRKGNVDEILDDLEDSIDECIERLLPVHQSFPGHPHGTSQM